jgi:hypothetical protein
MGKANVSDVTTLLSAKITRWLWEGTEWFCTFSQAKFGASVTTNEISYNKVLFQS